MTSTETFQRGQKIRLITRDGISVRYTVCGHVPDYPGMYEIKADVPGGVITYARAKEMVADNSAA